MSILNWTYRNLHLLLDQLGQLLSRVANDPLLNCMDTAHVNIVHALTDPWLQLETTILRGINHHFLAVRDNISDDGGNETYAFFIRSYSSWRTAVRLWASGTIPECYTVLRSSLEYTAQGHRLRTGDTELFEKWINRHAYKAHRNQFTFKKALASIESNFAQLLDLLYDLTIELGAHPNPAGTFTGVRDSDEGHTQVVYQGGTQYQMLSTADHLALAGVCILQIYKGCYSDAFKRVQGMEQSLAALTLDVAEIVQIRENLREQDRNAGDNNLEEQDLGWVRIVRQDNLWSTTEPLGPATAPNPN